MFYVHLNLHYHTFIFKKKVLKSVALLQYVRYALTACISTHVTPLLLTPQAKRWGVGVRSFCTWHVYLLIPTLVVNRPIVRAAIIEYALSDYTSSLLPHPAQHTLY